MVEPGISFEFFPPRSPEVAQRLHQAATALATRGADYFSVTYGADGSGRDGTANTVQQLRRATGVAVVPHISCIATSSEELCRLLDRYRDSGVKRLVAVRGDRPAGFTQTGSLRFGSDLVAFIHEHYGDHFSIYVAAYPERHPEATSLALDLESLRCKVEAGANSAITQYFYNIDAYVYFVEACRAAGIEIPIIPGIMPIHDMAQVQRFSARCGADVPRWLVQRMASYSGAESRRELAAEFVADLCRRLLQAGAPGVHFYTLNRAAPSLAILERLSGADVGSSAGNRSVA